MDSNMQSLPLENVEAKAAFRKPSNPAANRKYRHHSPASRSSSSEGSPIGESGTSQFSSRADSAKVSEHQQRRKDDERELDRDPDRNKYSRDSFRHSDRYSSRNSHGYSRHEEYSRHEKHADDEERHYQTSSRSGRESRVTIDHAREESERGKSRDYTRNADKYSRDRYDSLGHRSKEKETVVHKKFRDRDSSPDRAGSDRKHTITTTEEKDRDRHKRDRDVRDEKRDYHRSFGDYRSDRELYPDESRGYRNDSGRDHDGYRYRESSKNEKKELNYQKEKKKYDNWGANKEKDNRVPLEQNEDKPVLGNGSQDSVVKKPKLFTSDRDADYSKDANEKQPSKQIQEVNGNSEAANDLNAAKVAAMKAAELVNRNLVGVGLSTEQKKRLLWGNKKSTAPEESGHQWDTSSFGDRERQEKFHKLMSLRLHWYLWPIVGCERRSEGRSQRRGPSGQAERSTTGFREAVHCWSSTKRWPHCWVGSLKACLRWFYSRAI